MMTFGVAGTMGGGSKSKKCGLVAPIEPKVEKRSKSQRGDVAVTVG